jgi:carbonic anhydrase
MRLQPKEVLENLTPKKVLNILKDGNNRFINNLRINRNLLEQVNDTANGQSPFAIILSCIDSRTSAEIIFDQGLGDIFSVRIAGNVVNEDIVGSMEYACSFSGAKLILVLGHTNCSAIQGAYNNIKAGSLTKLLDKIKPAIDIVKKANFNNFNFDLLNESIAYENVLLSIQGILNMSPILKNMVDRKEIGIAGGVYDVNTGIVDFTDEHGNEKLD